MNAKLRLMRSVLEKQQFRFVGEHTAIKICHWTKASLREKGSCYKQRFYGINSHRCVQISPSVGFCQNNCIYCWREIQYSLENTYDKYEKIDEPADIVDRAIAAQKGLLTGFGGNTATQRQKWEESKEPVHFAISLSGEPTMYPKIAELIAEINSRGHSTFLVTNGMLPERLEELRDKGAMPTQLYLSVNATGKEMFDLIEHPLYKDAWERLQRSMDLVRSFRDLTRTVMRITCIKGYNMTDAAGWAAMLERCQPKFLEVKGYTFVGSSTARLTRENSPVHADVGAFAEELQRHSDYRIVDEQPVSRVVLMSQRRWDDQYLDI